MEKKESRLWTRQFVLVLAISLLSFVICQGLNNGTPIYIAENGGSNSFAGWLILEFSLAAALSRVLLSTRMDRGSRRGIMLLGALLTLAGSAGALALPALGMQVVFRAVQGLGFGLCTTAASTAASDVVPAARLGEGLGYYGLGQSLGMVIGPSLSIVLVTFTYAESPFGPTTLFLGMGALSVLLVLAVLGCTYEKHPDELDSTSAYRRECCMATDKAKRDVKDASERYPLPSRYFEKAAIAGALPMAVICLGFSIITNFVSKYGVEQGFAAPGAFFICAAIAMTTVRLAGGRLIDSVRPLALLAVPVLCGMVSFLILALAHAEALLYVAGAFFGLSMGIAFPLLNTVAVRCSPMERRGAATALYLLANDMGVGIGAVIGGAVIDSLGYIPCFWEGAALMAAAFLVACLTFPRKRHEWKERP